MTGPDLTFLDGNAAAGPLSEIFTADVTAARGECATCGRRAVLADTLVYVQAPGLVVRCRGCEGVLLRIVSAPGRRWLDMRGVVWLEMAGDSGT